MAAVAALRKNGRPMARLLIVGGGARGRWLAQRMGQQGHVARILTRDEAGRAAIELAGAECFIGDPGRLARVTGALEGVTIGCWLLGCASGGSEELADLHGSRLEAFIAKTVDSTVRGFIYEAAGSVSAELLAGGGALTRRLCERNEVPFRVIEADPREQEAWREQAQRAVLELLGVR